MSSVLIVEDDSTLRELLFELFSEQYSCSAAQTADEALSRLDSERFDVVLTDISMPGMSGLELLGHIKQRWPETAVIIVSGIRDKEYAEGLLRMGAFDFLVKPFELLDVYNSVNRVLGQPGNSSEHQRGGASDSAEKKDEPAEAFSSIQLDKVFSLADLLEMVQRSRMNGYVCLYWDEATVEEARRSGRFNDADGNLDEAVNHRAATIYLRDGLIIDVAIADAESHTCWREPEVALVMLVRLATWVRVGLCAWGFSTSDMRRAQKLEVNDNSGKLFSIVTSDEGSSDDFEEGSSGDFGEESSRFVEETAVFVEEPIESAEAEATHQSPPHAAYASERIEEAPEVEDRWVVYPI
jgi:DNA-binding response OmpR family regulator